MSPDWLEEKQISIYFAAVAGGLLCAALVPGAEALEPAINPTLAALLYVTFLQVPLAELGRSLRRLRFLAALLAVNFVVVPLVAFGLSAALLPADSPALHLGVLMVLLTPCVDYVVAFTRLGRGDAGLVLAMTPVLLVAQMLLLPLYLAVFLGPEAARLVRPGPFVEAFLWLIAAPLALAALTQAWAARRTTGRRAARAFGWLPVPLMALVLFVVLAAVIPRLGAASREIARTVPVYVAFAVIMPFVARLTARLFRLDVGAGRALVFSACTRNSLVVLPLAFAAAAPEQAGGVPAAALVPAVIITQTLVELISELVYVRVVPRLLPAADEQERQHRDGRSDGE